MERAVQQRLVLIMGRLASGDAAAVVTLYQEFGGHVAAAVRRHLSRMRVVLPRDELEGVVLDACFALRDCARGWDPAGGALPWVWADRRIGALVARHVGPHSDPLDGERLAALAAPVVAAAEELDDLDDLRVLVRLAASRPSCRLLVEALTQVATARNRALLLAYGVQTTLGDPSPACTVGRQFGMQPEAVRQAVSRTRRRLRALAQDDVRFGDLRGIPLLAA